MSVDKVAVITPIYDTPSCSINHYHHYIPLLLLSKIGFVPGTYSAAASGSPQSLVPSSVCSSVPLSILQKERQQKHNG